MGEQGRATGTPSRLVPVVLLVGGAAIYGSIFSANKIAGEAGFPFIAYSFWIAALGTVALGLAGLVTRDLPRLSAAHLRQYAVTAVCGYVVPILVLAAVATRLPASVVTLVLMLTPALTYVFAWALRLERLRWLSLGGVALGLVGVLMIVLPAGSLPGQAQSGWLLLALLAPLGFAGNNVAVALLRPVETSTLSLATGALALSALLLLPAMLAFDGAVLPTAGPAAGGWALMWASVDNIVVFLCLFEIIRRAGPVFFSHFNYIGVAAGVVWAQALFDERLSLWVWGAMAVMVVGLVLANAGANRAIRERTAAA